MDYKCVREENGSLVIEDVENFEPVHIFECGQCFRWNRQDDGSFRGTAFGLTISVKKEGNNVIISDSDIADFNNIWKKYFDLERDYSRIKLRLSEDPLLKESVEFGHGIRILNQEPFEMLISFIISANNQIPRIKKTVDRISEKWGNEIISSDGKKTYSFPKPSELQNATVEELKEIGLGYRAEYIYNTVKMVTEGEKALEKKASGDELTPEEEEMLQFNLSSIVSMDHENCHRALMKYSGVGPKVADCIMLFSMEKQEAFPVDVWVKKAMTYFYKAPEGSLPKIRKFGQGVFGDLAGFAQQYLFYNARENKIKIETEDPKEKEKTPEKLSGDQT